MRELSGEGLVDTAVLRLADRVELVESEEFNAGFPARRFARVVIEAIGGATYESAPTEARWDAPDPPADEELRQKFRRLVGAVLSGERVDELETAVWRCHESPDVRQLQAQLAAPKS